jgi:hypothetical protein
MLASLLQRHFEPQNRLCKQPLMKTQTFMALAAGGRQVGRKINWVIIVAKQ